MSGLCILPDLPVWRCIGSDTLIHRDRGIDERKPVPPGLEKRIDQRPLSIQGRHESPARDIGEKLLFPCFHIQTVYIEYTCFVTRKTEASLSINRKWIAFVRIRSQKDLEIPAVRVYGGNIPSLLFHSQ